MANTAKNVNELKIALYDVLEAQSVLSARVQQLEQNKQELMKQLSEARKAAEDEVKEPAPAPRQKKKREVVDDEDDDE